jgi:CBS domain-containing protein
MTRSVITVGADTDIVTVAEMFLKGSYHRFPVTSGDRVVGVIDRRETLQGFLELCSCRPR